MVWSEKSSKGALDSCEGGAYHRSMPRKRRIQYPGAMYHVMSRGDGGGRIYLEDADRHDFKALAEACQKTGWQVHAYCLMSNHYHLVAETPEPNLVAGMAWLQSTYTIRLSGWKGGALRKPGLEGGGSGRAAKERSGEAGDCRAAEKGDSAFDQGHRRAGGTGQLKRRQ